MSLVLPVKPRSESAGSPQDGQRKSTLLTIIRRCFCRSWRPWVSNPQVTSIRDNYIRQFILTDGRSNELVVLDTLTPPAAAFLEASVRARLNIPARPRSDLLAAALRGAPAGL